MTGSTPGDGSAATGAAPEVGAALSRLAADDLGQAERLRVIGALGRRLAGAGVREAGIRAAVTGRWLADLLADAAPHLPVRDLLTLREHHDGLSGDELAASLIRSASRATAAVGAAGGTVHAASVAAPPSLLAAPFTLAAETLAVVAVELKLVAELHVVFGRAPVGTRAQVATAYLSSWAAKKGIDPLAGRASLASVLGTAARQQLRARVARRLGRNLATLAPFLTGAVAGAELNRRETVKLGAALQHDLRTGQHGQQARGARPGGRRRPW